MRKTVVVTLRNLIFRMRRKKLSFLKKHIFFFFSFSEFPLKNTSAHINFFFLHHEVVTVAIKLTTFEFSVQQLIGEGVY